MKNFNSNVIASERSERSNLLGSRSLLRRASLCSALLAMTISAFIISGCGYTNRSLIAPDADTIFVDTFKNSIDITKEITVRQRFSVYKPFIEVKVTNAVIKRILYDGNFKIVNRDLSDLLLTGEVIDYLRQPLRYSDAKDILEYRLNVIINFKLQDLKTGKVLLDEKNLTADTTYFVTGKSAKSEDSAIDTLLEDLSRRVISRIVNRW
ncbi:MAG: hypothetical protein COZ98_04085 [Candidatus Omnitrophica bacterium CG_4_8_14_3_um_filter_43_15]|nr:MAG: hypothetical protein COS48_02080 [Candidatus Omnitrophica bacterium CG03_land_8_20_14_0_80_43_22]PIW80119.1 MAG: hypothetical protein COZ98_04085 [Candidatus Omnitrophica bacterium CG_4_8_14_3_um_filter_43_15]PJC46772.1 MAG: hypothetical protein CO036_01175 [Candidatus Omnitrophica bacterium CG_4_9_14_0_2_um_filter_43_12]